MAAIVGSQMITGLAGPAHAASQAECVGGANGFRDISDSASGIKQVYKQDDSRTVEINIQTVVLGHETTSRGFAKIQGQTRSGDLIWMDWTRDHGRTWIQCGPFTITANGQTKTSAAQSTSSDDAWRFRAGGVIRGKLYVTDWW
ncbi:hypothetical protein [Nonomuraea antimicrobica]|uniref:hypothetical protein n=1 Tax=Nonomuraea antimicrobica TaxID=561173 RepID=UPI0031E7D226